MQTASALPDHVLRSLPEELQGIATTEGGVEALVAMSAMLRTQEVADRAGRQLVPTAKFLATSTSDEYISDGVSINGARARAAKGVSNSLNFTIAASLTGMGATFAGQPSEDKDLATNLRELQDQAKDRAMQLFARANGVEPTDLDVESFWSTVDLVEQHTDAMEHVIDHLATMPTPSLPTPGGAVEEPSGFVSRIQSIVSNFGHGSDEHKSRLGDKILAVALDVFTIAEPHRHLLPSRDREAVAASAYKRLSQTDLAALEAELQSRGIDTDTPVTPFERLAVNIKNIVEEASQNLRSKKSVTARRTSQIFNAAFEQIDEATHEIWHDEAVFQQRRPIASNEATPAALLDRLPHPLYVTARDRQGVDALLAIHQAVKTRALAVDAIREGTVDGWIAHERLDEIAEVAELEAWSALEHSLNGDGPAPMQEKFVDVIYTIVSRAVEENPREMELVVDYATQGIVPGESREHTAGLLFT